MVKLDCISIIIIILINSLITISGIQSRSACSTHVLPSSPTLGVQVVKDSTSSSSNTVIIVRGKGPNSPCIQIAKMLRPNKEVEPESITR